MRIQCPRCEVAYEVPEAVLASRRMLRCGRCATDFETPAHAEDAPHPGPPGGQAGEAVGPVAALPPPGAGRDGAPPGRAKLAAATKHHPGLRLAVAAAWAASLIVVAGLAWAAIAWRAPVMRAWPPATRLYAALGYRA